MVFNALFGASSTDSATHNSGQELKKEYLTEFHRICDRFIAEDVSHFLEKYPLIGLVAAVALGFFGLMNVFSFSPTNILTGAFILTLSFCLGKGMWNKGIFPHLIAVQDAIGQLIQYRSQIAEAAKSGKPDEASKD